MSNELPGLTVIQAAQRLVISERALGDTGQLDKRHL